MSRELIAYAAMWASIGVTLATGVMAFVTWRMARAARDELDVMEDLAHRTAEMAEATRDLAQSARDELEFMRSEADARTMAHVRIVGDTSAHVENSLNASGR